MERNVIFIVLLLIFALKADVRGKESETNISFVELIQETAETMEVFPVDLIARDGPLSYFEKGRGISKISIREEIDAESFKNFYLFFQLALNATPEDINACVDYLPLASAKEKALILTTLYVYAYPWEEQKRVTEIDELIEALSTRSWASLQYPCDAFDLSVRRKYQRNTEETMRLAQVVARYTDDVEIAFQAVAIEKDGYQAKNVKEWRGKWSEVMELVGSLEITSDDPPSPFLLNVLLRKIVIDGIRRKYPDSSQDLISDVLYAAYPSDTFDKYTSGLSPREGNTSKESKTVGQIAQELLDSWNPPLLLGDENHDSEDASEKTNFIDKNMQRLLDF